MIHHSCCWRATYTLGEIHVDTVIINQHPLHFEIGLFTVLLVFKLDKGILQAVTRSLIPYNLTRQNWPEPAENEMEILV